METENLKVSGMSETTSDSRFKSSNIKFHDISEEIITALKRKQ